MEINYTNSREDIINFHMQRYTKTKSYRNLNNMYLAFIIFITSILTIMVLLVLVEKILNLGTRTDIKISLPCFIIFDLFLIILRKKYIEYTFRLKLNAVYNNKMTNSYFNRTKLIIDEDYLNLFTNLDKKSYKWESIRDIFLIDDYIFITTTARDDILIPLSCFNSPKEMNSFLTIILKYTNLELKMSYPIDI